MAEVDLRQGREGLRQRRPCRPRPLARDRRRRVRRARRAVGVREDDGAADGCGPRGHHRRQGRRSAAASSTTCRRRSATSRWCSRTTRSIPISRCADNIGFGLRLRHTPKDVVEERVAWAAKLPRPDAVPQPQAEGAFRRPAPARGDGPRNRPQAAGLSDGRAPLEPRREAARADARRDRADPARHGRHDAVRHARPGRGDDDGRPRRGHAEGRAAADGGAADAVRLAEEPLRRELHRQSRR